MEIYLAAPEPVNKNRRAIVESTKPQWRSISVTCIAIQDSRSMEHGKKLLAVRRWSRLWVNAAMTFCVSRSFGFCAITNLYLLRERTPFNVTTMAMARGGLSCDVKGVLSPHSRTASASGFSLRLMILD